MKVRLVIVTAEDFASTYGGGQVYVRQLAAEANRRGAHAFVVMPNVAHDRAGSVVWDITNQKRTELDGIPDAAEGQARTRPEASVACSSLERALAFLSPDVVHANGWKAEVARVCYARNIPCVITAHHGGLVCPQGALLDWEGKVCHRAVDDNVCVSCCRRQLPVGRLVDAFARLVSRRAMVRLQQCLSAVRNIPLVTPAVRLTFAAATIRQRVHSLALPGQYIVAPSRIIAEALVRNGIPESHVVRLPHGIEPIPKSGLIPGLGSRPVQLLFVGRINRGKGLHVLLSALRLLPANAAWELHIVGQAITKHEKRYQHSLMRKVSHWPRIVWHGQLDRDGVVRRLAASDILIVPSICAEAFGLVIAEAFSAGRPVIATRCGGPEDLVCDGVDGLLVPPNDVGGLSTAIWKIVDRPVMVEQLAAGIRPAHTLQEHLRDLESVYEAAMRRRSGHSRPAKS